MLRVCKKAFNKLNLPAFLNNLNLRSSLNNLNILNNF